MRYWVYIIFSKATNRFYTGQTDCLERRVDEHNNGYCKSTRKGIPWVIVYNKETDTRGEAMKLENSIKKRGAERFLKGENLISDI